MVKQINFIYNSILINYNTQLFKFQHLIDKLNEIFKFTVIKMSLYNLNIKFTSPNGVYLNILKTHMATIENIIVETYEKLVENTKSFENITVVNY